MVQFKIYGVEIFKDLSKQVHFIVNSAEHEYI
jgi:hypothetical protein